MTMICSMPIAVYVTTNELCILCVMYRQERLHYYENRERARDEPTKYMSLIVDGMDQNKTNLPHFVRLSKSAAGLWVLRTHITGFIQHGVGAGIFIDFQQWPHDSNLTINILMQLLLSSQKPLADTLLLQMDNCARENKNKYVFAFLALLVELEVFVEVSSLQ